MYRCNVCGKEYQRKSFYDKHILTHEEPSPMERVLHVLGGISSKLDEMDSRIALLENTDEEDAVKESFRRIQEMQATVKGNIAKKLAVVKNQPLMDVLGVGDDDGEPEKITLYGETWTIPIGQTVSVPAPVGKRCIQQRQLRKYRDMYAESVAIPDDKPLEIASRESIERQTEHIRSSNEYVTINDKNELEYRG